MLRDVKKVLVFVESPFQVRNLLDFAEYYPSIRFNVIARLNGDKKNDNAIWRMVKVNNQPNLNIHLIRISRSGTAKFFELVKLLPIIPIVYNSAYVIFFDDRSLIYRVLNRFVRGSILLADDGAYSFVKISDLEKTTDKRIAGFITRFRELRSKSIEVLHVPYRKVQLETSDYSIFIGMPLFEKGLVSKKTHLEIIKKIVKKLNEHTNNEVYYFPHRSEYAYQELELKVVESELSIEEYIERVPDRAPSHLVSMYSTALFVISSKFEGLECFYHRLPENSLNDDVNFKNINLVYQALERSECKELW